MKRMLVLLALSVILGLTAGAFVSPAVADPVAELPPLKPVDPSTTTTTSTLPPLEPVQQSSTGLFDVGGRVRDAINEWFTDLVTSALNPTLDLLGRSLLSAPNVTQQDQVHSIWLMTLAIADATFVIFALVGGFVVMTHETVQSRYTVKEIAPRLVVGVLAANLSLVIAGQAIEIANALSRAALGEGVDPQTATSGIDAIVAAAIGSAGIFMVLLGLVIAVLGLLLVVIYLARAVCVVLLVVFAPLALICHALPQTEGIAKLWWRASAACLGIQIAQSLVLITAIRVFFSDSADAVFGLGKSGLVDLLVIICLFWVMFRIPNWAGRMVFGASGGPVKVISERIVTTVKTAAKAVAAS